MPLLPEPDRESGKVVRTCGLFLDGLTNGRTDCLRDMPSTLARRFAAMLGELTGGRVGLSAGSVGTLKLSLTTAVRYAVQRRQFGPSTDVPEIRTYARLCVCRRVSLGLYDRSFVRSFPLFRFLEGNQRSDVLVLGG